MRLFIAFFMMTMFVTSVVTMDVCDEFTGLTLVPAEVSAENRLEKVPRKLKQSTAYAAGSLMTCKGYVEPEDSEKSLERSPVQSFQSDRDRHIAGLCNSLRLMVNATIALESQSPVEGDGFED